MYVIRFEAEEILFLTDSLEGIKDKITDYLTATNKYKSFSVTKITNDTFKLNNGIYDEYICIEKYLML